MAFAITEDHARQEQVFENLHHNREPWIIRRDMTAGNVPADDRRAVFVGADAYIEAGGNIIRDLFTEDRGGFFEDAGLLDMLATERLRETSNSFGLTLPRRSRCFTTPADTPNRAPISSAPHPLSSDSSWNRSNWSAGCIGDRVTFSSSEISDGSFSVSSQQRTRWPFLISLRLARSK